MNTQDAEIRRLTNRLVAVVRDEVAAHERLDALLERQEATVTAPSSDAFRTATEAIEAELARAPHRASKRNAVLESLGNALGVAAGALTLTSLCERLGDDAAALRPERDRLEEVANRTRKRTRKIAALVRMHREVTRELLQAVLGDGGESGADVLSGGTLIDAEV